MTNASGYHPFLPTPTVVLQVSTSSSNFTFFTFFCLESNGHFTLMYTDSIIFLLGIQELSCQKNPLVLSALHGQRSPVHKTVSLTLHFTSSMIGVLGVALRSPASISVPAMGKNQSPSGQGCRYKICLPIRVQGKLFYAVKIILIIVLL